MKKTLTIGGIVLALLVLIAQFLGVDPSQLEDLKDDTVVTDTENPKKQEEVVVVEPPTTTGGKLKGDYLPTTNLGDTLGYTYFTLSYSRSHSQAEWVAYELLADNLMKEDENERLSYFFPDKRLPQKEAVLHEDYTASGYDRGHLCAAADMSWSKKGIEETFVTTNISPQDPKFNRGIWKSLETYVRGWAVQFGHLYVVTGPVLTRRAKARFPKEKHYIAVPKQYYKALLYYYGDEKPMAIGFLLDNADSKEHLSKFVVSLDELEKLTDLDFFPQLPDDVEAAVEANFDVNDWFSTFSTPKDDSE